MAEQVITMLVFGFSALGFVTLLLAVYPGRDVASGGRDQAHDADLSVLQADDDELSGRLARLDASHGSDSETDGRPLTEVVDAFRRAAAREAQQRLSIEQELARTQQRVEELEAQLAAFREGTSAEMRALRAQYREEAMRDAMRKVNELAAAADRLTQTLRDARARAQQDVEEAVQRGERALAVERERNAEAIARKEAELSSALAALQASRAEGASDGVERVRSALQAVDAISGNLPDAAQRDAVQMHQEGLLEAVSRLDSAPERDGDGDAAHLMHVEASRKAGARRSRTAFSRRRAGLRNPF